MQALTPPWKAVSLLLHDAIMVFSTTMIQPWKENLTGTRGAYKPYDTAAPRVYSWEPKAISRE